MKALPKWDLKNIYASFESEDYLAALEQLKSLKQNIVELAKSQPRQEQEEAAWLKRYLTLSNSFSDLWSTLYAFAYMRFSTNTADFAAVNAMNKLDEIQAPVKSSLVIFREKLAQLSSLASLIAIEPELKPYTFVISEQLLWCSYQLSANEEELAQDLLRCTTELWSRLQEAISSNLTALWDARKKITKTITELRALAFAPKREVRKKAFRLEKKLWQSMQTPLAFSLNGVKGFTVVLGQRRAFPNLVEQSLLQARLSRPALEALLSSLHNALPDFRHYFRLKAQALGLPRLAFFDLFAPLNTSQRKWEFNQACDFIVSQFGNFSKELADFARKAFEKNWIDAAPRQGKVGGAYCISLPLKQESRVLCNFSGDFNSVTTMAHELGHAYHHEVLKQLPALLRDYPMTLAETASIFAENLVFEGALKEFSHAEKLGALEHFLQDAAQIVVDILSRYLFEKRLCAERSQRELSPEEICNLMLEAQRETYGDALDPKYLHPYMWAAKSHYYRPELPFYNYPYAFGLLFGLALLSRFKEEGKSFAKRYKSLLQKTGCATCQELAQELGFNIEKADFWESAMAIIRQRIQDFEQIVLSKAKRSAR